MVDQDKVRMFITQLGPVIGEEVIEKAPESADGMAMLAYKSRVKLNHPLRLIPQGGDSVSVGPLFMKEEWCIVPDSCMEISVENGIRKLYSDYETKIFSSIIIADQLNTQGLKL